MIIHKRPTCRTSTGNARSYCEEEIHHCPTRYEQPYAKREEVAISQSGLPGAGRGLFGIRPCKGNPPLFKQANEFVFVYATMQDVISVTEAQATESAYVWTNSKNLHLDWDPAALYFITMDKWSMTVGQKQETTAPLNGMQNADEWRCGRWWMFPYARN